MNKISLIAGIFICSQSTMAATVGDALIVNAEINSACVLNVGNIHFASLNAPLISYTGYGALNVRCTKNLQYSISLSYGGMYGQGSITKTYYAKEVEDSDISNSYVLTYSSKEIGSIQCLKNGNVSFSSIDLASEFGYSKLGETADINNVCNSGVIPSNFEKRFIPYDYGVMIGMDKGDRLAYAISLPNDSSIVWNNGIGVYNGVGNGQNQSIPLNTKIIPEKSSSKFLAKDFYMDTITVYISY